MRKLFINAWEKDFEFLDFKPNSIFLMNTLNEKEYLDLIHRFNNCDIYDISHINAVYPSLEKIKGVINLHGEFFCTADQYLLNEHPGIDYLLCSDSQMNDPLLQQKIYLCKPKRIIISTKSRGNCVIEKKHDIYHVWMGKVFVD